MQINVALIAPEDFIETVMSVSKEFPILNVTPYGYLSINKTIDIVNSCKDYVDVLLFAGPIPFKYVQAYTVINKPMLYLPHNGTSLYRVLFQMLKDDVYRSNSQGLRFSIDILKEEEVYERLQELEIAHSKVYVKEYDIHLSIESFLQYHLDLWKRNKIDIVLTCIASVYNQLVLAGVPCYRIVPTKSTIRDTFEHVLLEGKSVYLSSTQLAIGIIRIDNFSVKHSSMEYERKRKKLELQQVLLDYSEETQALINWTDRDEVTFVTTRGIIEKSTNGFQNYPLLDCISNDLHLQANIGIGFGPTANEADNKAREALTKATLNGEGNCFVATFDGNVHGPIGSPRQLEYSIRSVNQKLIEIARHTELSVGTLNKIISYCEKFGSTNITAGDFSHGFGVSVRSARRLLQKLEKNKLAKVIGEEQPIGRGRPRQIYNITISTEE